MSSALDSVAAGDPSALMAVDPWAWAYYGELVLNGGIYSIKGHEHQVAPMQCDARVQCAKKATQRGWTEILVIRALHAMKHGRYPQGALYLFPTSDEVTDFSASRFKPFLKDNLDQIGRYVRDTDRANLKSIGDAFLFFRGARLSQNIDKQKKSSSKLKSLPVDAVFFDEFDEMDPGAEKLALARMQHSDIRETWYLANPTIPDFGIDKKYQQSDQRIWVIRCDHCGTGTSLDLEFPNCLKRSAGASSSKSSIIDMSGSTKVIRACKKCGKEIHPQNGIWVAQYPDKSKDIVGWWDSQLGSAYISPKELLDEWESEDLDKQEFKNLKLGLAYIASENRLTKQQIYGCCSPDPMPGRHPGPNGMGVDVGKNLNVVIGNKPFDGGVNVVKIAEVGSFQDVYDLAIRYGVTNAVFDLYPETRKVRSFRAMANFTVYGCAYSESQKGEYAWNEKDGVVTVNRTELCDTSHELIVKNAKCKIPRKDAVVEEYATQMCNIAKVLEEDKQSGTKIYRYRKLGPDHYRHSMNYLILALHRMPVSSTASAPKQSEWYYD